VTTDLILAGRASRALGVSHTQLVRMARSGELRLAGKTAEGFRLFRQADVERLAEQRAAAKVRRDQGRGS